MSVLPPDRLSQHDYAMVRDPAEQATPDLSRPTRFETPLPHLQSRVLPQRQQHLRSGISCQRTCLTPSNNSAMTSWTGSLRWCSMKRNAEADRRGALVQILRRRLVPRLTSRPNGPRTDEVRNDDIWISADVTLTRGQMNAVRSAFKAGVTPSRIARQFGISQANVRKALASDERKR